MSRPRPTTATELRESGRPIKPCPFCGEPDYLQVDDDGVHWPKIACTNCGGQMPGESVADALAGWNKRASG
jgi:Lar family restriction alleviation protein